MAVYKQLVAPRKGTQDGAGWCLRFAQSFFGAPVAHPSAWAAWNAATHKHGTGEALPTGAAVLVWFSHYGTYQGVYANWGHVAVYVPGDGIYTSPASGWGQGKYGTLAEIERVFNAKYVGWSEAINGLRVAEPAALSPTQRQAFPGGKENDVKRREQPTSKSKDLGDPIPAGDVGNFNGWIYGESVAGNTVWFRGISGAWFWSGGFTNKATAGLTDLNPVKPPVKPPVNPPVEPEQPARPDYVMFEAFSPVVTAVNPAHSNNYEVGNIPADQTDAVLHDFGTHGRDTFGSAQNQFRNGTTFASSHFVVSWENITQMVKLTDRAYHAGPKGNGIIGIEIDPVVGQPDGTPGKAETIASVRKLLVALAEHYGRVLTNRKHPEFMDTSCGDDIDLTKYVVELPTEPVSGVQELIQLAIQFLKRILGIKEDK